MTKPVTRKLAVDCLLYRLSQSHVCGAGDPAHLLCGICKEPLLPGQTIQFDHIHSDVMGGPHEYQNLRPVHYDPCHKKKTKKDVGAKAKLDRLNGLTKNKPKAKIPNRPMKSGSQKIPSRPFPKRRT